MENKEVAVDLKPKEFAQGSTIGPGTVYNITARNAGKMSINEIRAANDVGTFSSPAACVAAFNTLNTRSQSPATVAQKFVAAKIAMEESRIAHDLSEKIMTDAVGRFQEAQHQYWKSILPESLTK